MNIKQLEVFLAVAKTGSFSKGAAATFITQSTVSQHIAALEQEFELALLDRTGKGALPTEAGKLLVLHGERIVAGIRAAELALQRFKGVEEASLTVGGSNIPAAYLMPPILSKLQQRFPAVAVTVCQGDSRGVLDLLAREEVELCMVGSHFFLEGVDFEPVGKEAIRLVVGRNHSWYQGPAVNLAAITNEPLLCRETGSGTGKVVLEALARAGIQPDSLKVKAVLGSNEAVKQAVMGGLGASFVSESSVQRELAQGDLAVVTIEELEIVRTFYLAVRSGRALSPAAKAFIEVVQEMQTSQQPQSFCCSAL